MICEDEGRAMPPIPPLREDHRERLWSGRVSAEVANVQARLQTYFSEHHGLPPPPRVREAAPNQEGADPDVPS